MPSVDVLIPTINRLESLIFTLSGVAAQDCTDIHVIIADQSDVPAQTSRVVQTLSRVIEVRGGAVNWFPRAQIHGVAEQRDFLLSHSRADAVLYLDDDVFMEPWVLSTLLRVLRDQRCGFVGAFPAGLSHRDDVRPEQQLVEFWDGPVHPEIVVPESSAWQRFHLHRAANLYHLSRDWPADCPRLYKVAWVASCVLYDRSELLAVGGFGFWNQLPRWHSGEEVLVQNLIMRRKGGCGIAPSGTYYSQVDTTVLNDRGTVDGHALDLLEDMVARYAPNECTTEKPVR